MTNPFIFTYKGKYAPEGTWEQLNMFQKHLLSGKLTDIPINPSWEDFERTKLSYPTPDQLQEGTEAEFEQLEIGWQKRVTTDCEWIDSAVKPHAALFSRQAARLKLDEQREQAVQQEIGNKKFKVGEFAMCYYNKYPNNNREIDLYYCQIKKLGEEYSHCEVFLGSDPDKLYYSKGIIRDVCTADLVKLKQEEQDRFVYPKPLKTALKQEPKTVQEKPEERELIEAAKYGYDYHAKTQFPEMSFEDNCKNNFLQFLQGHQSHPIQQEPQENEEAIANIYEALKKMKEGMMNLIKYNILPDIYCPDANDLIDEAYHAIRKYESTMISITKDKDKQI